MNKLEQYLNLASRQYYAGTPIISDEQFDQLAEICGYSQVGAAEVSDTQKHMHRMYSLQKYYEGENARPIPESVDTSVSVKLDGAAISLLYVDGVLSRVLTRGDGIEGKVITDKFVASGNNIVPQTIEHKGIVQIIGEIVAPSNIPNSRNYAAGALNLKSADEFKTKAVSFFAYGVQPYRYKTYDEDMRWLKRLGFSTVKESELDKIYPTDGIVFRVNDNQQFYEMGFTAKHPRGAYARKERGVAVETTLLDVEWNTGRTGRVTPTAILEPVYIGDKLVSRATLNNPGFIEMLDLQIGDRVGVILGGEIIPVITHKVDA